MPTPTEKRALIFLAGIALTGAVARAVGATAEAPPPPDARARAELHRQIEAVDSARRQGKGRGGRAQQRGRRSSPADSGGPAPTPSGGTWEPDRGAPPRVYYLSPGSTRAERMGAVRAAPEGSPGGAPAGLAPGLIPASTVDMDVASAAEIERLPRIGPALARRIVEDRTAHGPFGSLEELMRVKGIGPGIARAIAPFVTFTQTPRPSSEGEGATGAAGGRGRRLRKPHSP